MTMSGFAHAALVSMLLPVPDARLHRQRTFTGMTNWFEQQSQCIVALDWFQTRQHRARHSVNLVPESDGPGSRQIEIGRLPKLDMALFGMENVPNPP